MMYNQYPYNIFNQTYLSPNYLQQIQLQNHMEQQRKIANMVKAISDYCAAARDIEPSYQQEAISACLVEIKRQMMMDHR